MSAIIETFIMCDDCGGNYGVDSAHIRTAAQHREQAKSFGWIYRSGKDYCEKCAPKHNKRLLAAKGSGCVMRARCHE